MLRPMLAVALCLVVLSAAVPSASARDLLNGCIMESPPFTFGMLCTVTTTAYGAELALAGTGLPIAFAGPISIYIAAADTEIVFVGLGTNHPCDFWANPTYDCHMWNGADPTPLYYPVLGSVVGCRTTVETALYMYEDDDDPIFSQGDVPSFSPACPP